MIQHSATVPFSPQQMFDLINDIEAYPEYMNGCVGARILDRGDDWLTARLELAKAGIRHGFTTRNRWQAPQWMTMDLVEGPFKHLKGLWQFRALASGGCEVSFRLEYEFANFLLALAGNPLMQQTASEQVKALCLRARRLYE